MVLDFVLGGLAGGGVSGRGGEERGDVVELSRAELPSDSSSAGGVASSLLELEDLEGDLVWVVAELGSGVLLTLFPEGFS